MRRPSKRAVIATVAVAALVLASIAGPLTGPLLALGVALATWAGGWAVGLAALSVFPVALAFWPRVSVREWLACAGVLVTVAIVQRVVLLVPSTKRWPNARG